LWNQAFRNLNLDAIYVPFDVDEGRLPEFLNTLRSSPRVMGINVTVPYKVKVIPHLDRLDEKAALIQAVNTVVRTRDGQLIGFNTDGAGFLEGLQRPPPEQEKPLVQTLKGLDVLIIGAGGSARAVAFSLTEVLDDGQLLICNRTAGSASSLADEIRRTFSRVRAVGEEDLSFWAPKVGLIVNCSTKGQGGLRRTGDGKATTLEPYSALAPAHPAIIQDSQKRASEIYRSWLKASLADIEANNRASWNLALAIPPEVGFCDLIYFPEETVFLRHGRLSGHRTLNGQGMVVSQAVESFFAVCRNYLEQLGLDPGETRRRVYASMHGS
jgi:shikimate dehydrogenase